MTTRSATVLVVGSWILSVGSFVLLAVSWTSGMEDNLFHFQDAVVGLVFPALGWLVLRRQSLHPVGWILVVAGLSGALGAFGEEYVTVGFEVYAGSLPAVALVAWLGSWTWAFFFGLLPVLLLIFPDGNLLSRRWRPVLWVASVPPVLLPMLLAVMSWGAPVEVMAASAEPAFPAALEWAFEAGILVLAASLLAALISLGLRWRRSSGLTRQQMKVFFVGAAAGVLCLVLSQLEIPGGDLLGVVAFLLVPGGMVAAILRYRLYDIDRLVSRTVTYAAVTAVLVGIFFSTVFLLQLLLPTESDLATAASTLAVAAAFNPLRRRIQGFIDRRFNRARYDAARVAERFGRDLRSRAAAVDPTADLQRTVTTALEPSSVSVWLADDIPPEPKRTAHLAAADSEGAS